MRKPSTHFHFTTRTVDSTSPIKFQNSTEEWHHSSKISIPSFFEVRKILCIWNLQSRCSNRRDVKLNSATEEAMLRSFTYCLSRSATRVPRARNIYRSTFAIEKVQCTVKLEIRVIAGRGELKAVTSGNSGSPELSIKVTMLITPRNFAIDT